eukprot:CAMPEP_0115376910 /NCGR_PEP_ID=MMETSP0271-20121206/3219_1 /TAXON_ID=71861 /ORGANISM="Scrippsiella trochoidea, Strain CCMP3099" /LENGTH=57 /DNA_ID=CAMNT_0002800015 /DNA_START=109 /DNA_END=282 /DNA_ORIENTATION=+
MPTVQRARHKEAANAPMTTIYRIGKLPSSSPLSPSLLVPCGSDEIVEPPASSAPPPG